VGFLHFGARGETIRNLSELIDELDVGDFRTPFKVAGRGRKCFGFRRFFISLLATIRISVVGLHLLGRRVFVLVR
jgi:hypothetical protein